MNQIDQQRKLGLLIKEKRLRKCLSQEGLARETGLTSMTISRIELGSVMPAGHSLLILIKILNIDVKDLLNVYF